MNEEFIYLGYICDTHGIKGELKIKSKFDRKDKVFKPGFTLYLGERKEEQIISTYRFHKIYDMVLFEGYDNINQVLDYIGTDVFVKRSDLDLVENEYLIQDLIGLDVFDNEENIGKISDIMYNNGNTLLVVCGVKEFFIPLKSNYIEKVDIKNKKVITNNAKDLIL